MRYETIAEYAIDKYSQYMLDEVVRKAAKTLRRIRPHNMPWYEVLLFDAADAYRLNKKIYMGDLLLDIYPAPRDYY